nr:reverse transcriptase domain-containing protein [Tanacetum cinerariifolium]
MTDHLVLLSQIAYQKKTPLKLQKGSQLDIRLSPEESTNTEQSIIIAKEEPHKNLSVLDKFFRYKTSRNDNISSCGESTVVMKDNCSFVNVALSNDTEPQQGCIVNPPSPMLWCLIQKREKLASVIKFQPTGASSVGHQDSLGAWGGDVWLGEVLSSSPTRDFYPFRRNRRKYRRVQEEAKTKPNVWDDKPVDVNPFGGEYPSLGLKIEILEFTPKVHPNDFIDWLSTVERVFDVRDIPNKLEVKLVAIKLRQHALLWWNHVNKRRLIEWKSKVETWEKMKKLMKAKLLENHRQEAFLDYHNMSQQNMIVKVINEFNKLRMRCDVVEKEEQIKAKNKCSTSRFTSPTKTTSPIAPKIAPKATTLITSAAGTTREHVNNAPRCYKCGGLGHYARDCSNLKTLAFVPDDVGLIYDTDAELELDEP